MSYETLSATEIDRLAHKRAGVRAGLMVHAMVYVVVNLGHWGLALAGDRHLVMVPALAWGLGLAIHAAIVLMAMPGARLYQHVLQRERMRLQTQRDPW